MEFMTTLVIVFIACAYGIIWALYNWVVIYKIEIHHNHKGLNEKLQGEEQHKIETLLEIGQHISDEAQAFLKEEYIDCTVFIVIMAVALIFVSPWSTLIFILGAATSMLCGYLGMSIATTANYKTAFCAITSLQDAFYIAYRGGCVIGFLLVSISLFILSLIIITCNSILVKDDYQEEIIKCLIIQLLMVQVVLHQHYLVEQEVVQLINLENSFYFNNINCIYTKAADIGADLVGKVEKNLPEDSSKNPATIADNVGDNVGNILGMVAESFGSFTETICAALVISSTQLRVITEQVIEIQIDLLMYPLILPAIGIIISIAISGYTIFIQKFTHINKIVKLQVSLHSIVETQKFL